MQLINRKTIKQPFAVAVLSSFLLGFLIHLFGLVNIIHNHDDMCYFVSGLGTGVSSGRWVLTAIDIVLSTLGLSYNLPVVNGLIFLALISISVGFLIDIFKIQSKINAIIISAIFISFPTVTATMYYRFTIIPYGLAILFSVVAVWINEKHKLGIIASAILITLSLGIYQAYVPITISVFIILLIQRTCQSTNTLKTVILAGIRYCISLVLGLLLYLAGSEVSLSYFNVELNDYQGISSMGQYKIQDIPALLFKAFRDFLAMPLEDYCDLAPISAIKLLYIIIALLTTVITIILLILKVKTVSKKLIFVILLLTTPIAINFIAIMCPNSSIYTLMVYSFALIPCIPLILLEQLPTPSKAVFYKLKKIFTSIIAFFIAMLTMLYAYYDNVNYSAVYYSTVQAENMATVLIARAQMTDGYTENKKWAIVGELESEIISSPFQKGLTYGGGKTLQSMFRPEIDYSRFNWAKAYLGYNLPKATLEEIDEIAKLQEVKDMPTWPDAGSMKVIDDTLVIKFGEHTTKE